MKNAMHAKVDALMKEDGLDVIIALGNTPENPNFWYLAGGQKLEAAMLVWKRGSKKLLIAGDMERDCAAETGLDWIVRSSTPAMKLAKQAKKPGDYTLAYIAWALKKQRAKGKVAIYGSDGVETAVSWLPRLKRTLKEVGCELVVEKAPVVERARVAKNAEEVEFIRKAGVGPRRLSTPSAKPFQSAVPRARHSTRKTAMRSRLPISRARPTWPWPVTVWPMCTAASWPRVKRAACLTMPAPTPAR